MSRFKKFLLVLFALFGAPLGLFLILLFMTVGDYTVPQTVQDDAQLPRLMLNKTIFHAQTFGDSQNPPLLVLHDGPGGDYRNLLPLKTLSDRYWVIFYDQRGSGLSQRVKPEELTLETYFKDLEALISHYAGSRPITLIGHGWGGMMATRYTAQHPDHVANLVLLDPGFLTAELAYEVLPEMSKVTASKMMQLVMTWVKSFHIKKGDKDAGSDFILAEIRNAPAYYCDDSPMDWPHWRGGFGAWKLLTQSTLDSEGQLAVAFAEGIEAYTKPVLIVAGECNQLTGTAFQKKQARLFNDAEVVSLKQTGHMMVTENTAGTLVAIQRFLSKPVPN